MLIRLRAVNHIYHYAEKEPGLFSSFKSLFGRNISTLHALRDISLEVDTGEMVGILGPNGAGKSTLLKILSGVLAPSRGEVTVGSYQPHRRHPEYLSRISFVFGRKGQLEWELPASDSFLFCRDVYEIPEGCFRSRLEDLSERLGVGGLLNTPVRQLSLGQRMKCELIASLLHGPEILFLDEPTIGLDVVSQHELRKFLHEYNREHRCTVLLSTHHMKDVLDLCPRVIVLDGGEVIHDGPFSDLARNVQYRRMSVEFAKPLGKEALSLLTEALQQAGVDDTETGPAGLTLTTTQDQIRQVGTLLFSLDINFDLRIEGPDADTVVREIFAEGGLGTG